MSRSDYFINRLGPDKKGNFYPSAMNWIGLIASALPLVWGVQLVRQIQLARRLRKVGVEVVGQIVRQREVNGRGGRYSILTIGFTTQSGQAVAGESQGSTTDLEFFDGDEVALRYDPARPTCFLLAQELTGTSRYWWLAVAGALLAFLQLATWQ
jgi:hypothetical protein